MSASRIPLPSQRSNKRTVSTAATVRDAANITLTAASTNAINNGTIVLPVSVDKRLEKISSLKRMLKEIDQSAIIVNTASDQQTREISKPVNESNSSNPGIRGLEMNTGQTLINAIEPNEFAGHSGTNDPCIINLYNAQPVVLDPMENNVFNSDLKFITTDEYDDQLDGLDFSKVDLMDGNDDPLLNSERLVTESLDYEIRRLNERAEQILKRTRNLLEPTTPLNPTAAFSPVAEAVAEKSCEPDYILVESVESGVEVDIQALKEKYLQHPACTELLQRLEKAKSKLQQIDTVLAERSSIF